MCPPHGAFGRWLFNEQLRPVQDPTPSIPSDSLPATLPPLFSSTSTAPLPTLPPRTQEVLYPPTAFVQAHSARIQSRAHSSRAPKLRVNIFEEEILNTLVAVDAQTPAAQQAWLSVVNGTAIKDWPQKSVLELLYTVFKARWGALCGM